jgi:hypothetical protein
LLQPQESSLRACNPHSDIDAVEACLHDDLDASTSSVPEQGDDVDWVAALCGFNSRGQDECPICMAALCKTKKRRTCALLSCGHAFHATCITAFEAYHNAGNKGWNCPVCRALYSRCSIEHLDGVTWRLQRSR